MDCRRPILLVEDDKVDVMSVQRAFSELNIINRMEVAEDGIYALEYLRNPANERPCLILLDLNMPRMNGLEFLAELKQDQALKRIPVVVFTSSSEQQDVMDSYELCIAGYILKPVDYKQFVEVLRTVKLYWALCELPDVE